MAGKKSFIISPTLVYAIMVCNSADNLENRRKAMGKKKLFHIRTPKIRISRKGVKIQKPHLIVGNTKGVHVNVSKKGVSTSVTTKAGTVNTRKGISLNLFGLFGKKK